MSKRMTVRRVAAERKGVIVGEAERVDGRPVVYLSGPIFRIPLSEAVGWRSVITEAIGKAYKVIDPAAADRIVGTEEVERAAQLGGLVFTEFCRRIIRRDLEAIAESDVLVVWAGGEGRGWGTAMEIAYAKTLGKFVMIITGKADNLSPWLIGHADYLCKDLKDAAQTLLQVRGAIKGLGGEKPFIRLKP